LDAAGRRSENAMTNRDRDYFLRRAREERDIANCCEDNSVALTHFRFADEYERRAGQLGEAMHVPVHQP
jgi:hypothetical protein